ncbi:amino acid adenylation domain-containing protein [Sorangium sp. So ce269]
MVRSIAATGARVFLSGFAATATSDSRHEHEGKMTYLLHEALAGAFRDHATRTAIREEGADVTYGELEALVAKVARLLSAGADGGAALCREDDRFVGLSAAVTRDSVAAAIGILSAGRAYVPLDVQSPPARLAEVIADARLRVLLIDPVAYPGWEQLARCDGVEALVLLGAAPPASAEASARARLVAWSEVLSLPPAAPPRRPILSDDLAYILYTSGSTGVPKGVMLTHRNARTFVDWMAAEFEIDRHDRVASRAPLNFDLSVFDVFNTLAAGATLLIKDRREAREVGKSSTQRHREYVAMLRDERATVLYTTPSTFVTLLEKGGLDATVPLRVIMYAGEPFPPALLRKVMAALPRTRVANIYGPTETNIVTCHWVREPPRGDAPIPIGREVDDTEIEVVGEGGRRCAPGELGELWVRGGTVCVGYLGKDELTRERLVASPFHPYPACFWRTGDYGRRLPDGTLIYHGRLDNMVKTRGHRVELGDVETALSEHADLAQAVVVPIPHPSYGSTLHAFVLPREGATEVRPEEVMRFLEGRLPHYMLPWEIIVVSELACTSTGKVDRQLLIRTRRAQTERQR